MAHGEPPRPGRGIVLARARTRLERSWRVFPAGKVFRPNSRAPLDSMSLQTYYEGVGRTRRTTPDGRKDDGRNTLQGWQERQVRALRARGIVSQRFRRRSRLRLRPRCHQVTRPERQASGSEPRAVRSYQGCLRFPRNEARPRWTRGHVFRVRIAPGPGKAPPNNPPEKIPANPLTLYHSRRILPVSGKET
jgi:hypothetical protein